MTIRDITDKEKDDFNKVVNHPLQAFEWGEFRKKTGAKIIRKGIFDNGRLVNGFQVTIHKIPHTPFFAGYLPKGDVPSKEVIEELKKIGREEKCIFIQLEPHLEISNFKFQISNLGLRPSAHPLFTKYTFILDLTKPEEELLKNMHPKTRYNIRVAQKNGVKIIEDDSNEGFEEYLRLMDETTKRQKFYAHTQNYHKMMWETLKCQMSNIKCQISNKLTAHLFLAYYSPPLDPTSRPASHSSSPIPLVSWVVFVFKDTLYYPYGASSSLFKNVMASNLMMWEAIKFGKKLGLKNFDMWGALGDNPDKNDPWYGFHHFKEGYGPRHTEFIGSYDLVINPMLYEVYKISDKLRWLYLKMRK